LEKVYLDMDPGHDDALALLVALASLKVKGVTAVCGNQTVDKTARNARRVLDLAHYEEISVHQGADRPLFRPLVTAAHVHGSSGLDGYHFHLRDREKTIPADAQQWLECEFTQEPGDIAWIATGPLTNVAAFLMGHREFVPRIKKLTVMGGALNHGNITPYAEFNFYVDPDAAHWVLAQGIPIQLVGLDVTHKALLAPDALERFVSFGSEIGLMLHDLFAFYFKHEPNAVPQGVPVHDVLAVGAMVHPEFFAWRRVNLTVERCDEKYRGQMTVVSESARAATQVAVDVDVARFFEWMWAMLANGF
jgi:inosine-uridine nucleoside N-ribohydrolase